MTVTLLAAAPRGEAIRRYGLLEWSTVPALDEVAKGTALRLSVPIALINTVANGVQHTIGAWGANPPDVNAEDGFCTVTMDRGRFLDVADATQDSRFETRMAVTDFGVRAYFGVPLRAKDRSVMGTLCVVDTEAHVFSPQQRVTLFDLAAEAESKIEEHVRVIYRLGCPSED